jgi:hypothetical protein
MGQTATFGNLVQENFSSTNHFPDLFVPTFRLYDDIYNASNDQTYPIFDPYVPRFVDSAKFHEYYCQDLALAAAQKYVA